jgi:hypothetical protein
MISVQLNQERFVLIILKNPKVSPATQLSRGRASHLIQLAKSKLILTCQLPHLLLHTYFFPSPG